MGRKRMLMAELPKKWSRRIFAVYLIVTIFGGIILFLFIVLLGLTYWMSAPAPLPDPNLLIHPKATAWLVIRANSLRDLPPDTLRFLTDGAPPQIERLVALANGARPCPIQIVLSAFPGEHGPEKSLAVSLGRFPGRFMAGAPRPGTPRREDRPCPCRCAIASARPSSSPTSRRTRVEHVFSRRMHAAPLREPGRRGDADGPAGEEGRSLRRSPGRARRRRSRPARSRPWARTWQEIPLQSFFPADSASVG